MYDCLVLNHADNAFAIAGFILKNTLSDNGGVTRGICKVAEGHTHIIDVVETSNIINTADNGKIGAEADGVKLNPESYVSKNFWGFPAKEGCAPSYLGVLEQGFKEFFENDVKKNLLKAEYLLPTHIGGLDNSKIRIHLHKRSGSSSGIRRQHRDYLFCCPQFP